MHPKLRLASLDRAYSSVRRLVCYTTLRYGATAGGGVVKGSGPGNAGLNFPVSTPERTARTLNNSGYRRRLSIAMIATG
jgi:hypothetical protein